MNQQSEKKEPQKDMRLGEALIKSGLIDKQQLQQVLKRQTQVGGHLGSLLIEMKLISIDDLLNFLSNKFGVPGANLFKTDLDRKVLKLLPISQINAMMVLPISVDESTLTLAMVHPQDFMAISEIEFRVGKKIKPVVVPYFMMEAAIKSLAASSDSVIPGELIKKISNAERDILEKSHDLLPLLQYMLKSGASDLLLTAGVPPSVKIANSVRRLPMVPLTPEDCERYAREMMQYDAWDEYEQTGDADLSVTFPKIGRFRANVYRQRNSVAIAIRPIPDDIPPLEELNLPQWIAPYVLKPHGLILVSGPAGHGKTTTLNAMVDIINNHRQCNIITLEDPVEYLHLHKKSNINQREVGRDTASFSQGIKQVFRQAPDVIVVGEMRDSETFEIALTAAGTGHLVLSTVHSDNATSVIERTVNMFEPYKQSLIRNMIADSMVLILSQKLIPLQNGQGRILALEKLINSHRIKNLINEQKTNQIRGQMQSGAEEYECMDIAISKIVKKGDVKYEEGLIHVEDEKFFKGLAGRV